MNKTCLLVALLFFGLSLQAYAVDAVDPRFTFGSAEQAFANGRPPSAEELAKSWLKIGSATGSKIEVRSSYYPNGKFQRSGEAGYFFLRMSFTVTKDAFNSDIYSYVSQLIGNESGHVYESFGPNPGMITPTGYVVDFAPTSDVCGKRLECRMVNGASGLNMLCARTITEESRGCDKFHHAGDKARPSHYVGFMSEN